MKKSIFTFFAFVCLLSCSYSYKEESTTTSSHVEYKLDEDNTDSTIINDLGFHLEIPDGYVLTKPVGPEIAYYQNEEKQVYIQVFRNDREEIDKEFIDKDKDQVIEIFFEEYLGQMLKKWKSTEGIKQETDVTTKKIIINDLRAIQAEFVLNLKGEDFLYHFLMIETSYYYFTIMSKAIYSLPKEDANEFIEILNSFTEIEVNQ